MIVAVTCVTTAPPFTLWLGPPDPVDRVFLTDKSESTQGIAASDAYRLYL